MLSFEIKAAYTSVLLADEIWDCGVWSCRHFRFTISSQVKGRIDPYDPMEFASQASILRGREEEVATCRVAVEDHAGWVDGEVWVGDDGEGLRDDVFVGGGEFVLRRFAVVDADYDAADGVGDVAGYDIVGRRTIYYLFG